MTSSSINTFALEAFKDTVLFSITIRRWGNRAGIKDPEKLRRYLEQMAGQTEADEEEQTVQVAKGTSGKRVSASKMLVKSQALDRLNTKLTDTKAQCLRYAMPSFIKTGMFVIHKTNIELVDELLRGAYAEIENEFIPDFISDYPARKQDAQSLPVTKGGLGPLYDEGDYPSVVDMARRFSVSWNWLALTVPEGLPPELRQEESDKLQRKFADAATEIKDALRIMFAELVDHAVERLTITPGEKAKKFKDATINNINEFFATFSAKNIMRDSELEELVGKAKEIIAGVTPESLRSNLEVRDKVTSKLGELKASLDPMVEEIRSRAFDFSED